MRLYAWILYCCVSEWSSPGGRVGAVKEGLLVRCRGRVESCVCAVVSGSRGGIRRSEKKIYAEEIGQFM